MVVVAESNPSLAEEVEVEGLTLWCQEVVEKEEEAVVWHL